MIDRRILLLGWLIQVYSIIFIDFDLSRGQWTVWILVMMIWGMFLVGLFTEDD